MVRVRSSRLQDWIRNGQRVELAGHGVFVRTALSPGRPPLLLIHGYPTASYDWHHLWAPLTERFSVLALDMLGFGLSDKPRDAAYTIAGQADLCVALLEKHGLRRPHVLAHDYGDTVAQELLAREREGRLALSSVVFLNGGLFPEAHRPRPVQTWLAHPLVGPLLERAMSHARFAATMREIGGRTPPAEEELADLWSLMIERDGRRALRLLIDYMRQRRENRARWVGALVETKVPRLLVCGALDPVSGRHLAARYRELVPEPRVVLLEEIGHYPQLEAPEAVLEAFLAFHADRRDSQTQR
jgi:pimeloyl-ACP methyl ester carboxylesterase